MKLIFCPECSDVRKLHHGWRSCECGKSWGWYGADGRNATIGGKAIPLGIANPSFLAALQLRPKQGKGQQFAAFVIPRECPTVAVDIRKAVGRG